MRLALRFGALVALVLAPLAGGRLDARARESDTMARAANALLAALSSDQRAKAAFAFADAERINWHFIPRERLGLPLKEMTPPQRTLAMRLLETALSQRGYLAATTIIELELVLRELGGDPAMRDPERYFVSVFGTPGTAPWGWRFEGHHLSLNFTITTGGVLSWAPSFFGANPAVVRSGSRQGLRALATEEDVGRELVTALDSAQRARAIISADAPREIVTGNSLTVAPLSPVGIAIADLRPAQAATLRRVIEAYLSKMSDELATPRRAALQRSDLSQVTFAWAGPIGVGQPHYYRVQGPSFLIEFDNTQNNANHVHSVWRDFGGEFGLGGGRDPLREHYRSTPHPR